MTSEIPDSRLEAEARSSFAQSLAAASEVLRSLQSLEPILNQAVALCCRALRSGHKILACGNGGSACEAQHLVGELMGRYRSNRVALPAVAINADPVLITCIGNDFSFEEVFARQVQGLGAAGDVLVVFTTSGCSSNILRALSKARESGIKSVAFLGRDGGAANSLADCILLVPHPDTARIQEAHQFLLHSLMDEIERECGCV